MLETNTEKIPKWECNGGLLYGRKLKKHLENNSKKIAAGMEVHNSYMSYGQNLVHGEGTSLSRVGPYRFCSDANPRTLSILLWSYSILSDTHMIEDWKVSFVMQGVASNLGKKHKKSWQFLHAGDLYVP